MRDHGMFSFLSEGSDQSSKKDLDVLKEFAKEAASGFLGNSRTPLNHTIQKTAQNEKLSPDHIAIVCREANKAVHEQMFKTAENKYVDFEIADADVIVSDLDLKLSKTASYKGDTPENAFYEEIQKVASVSTPGSGDDFDFAPGEQKSLQGDFQMTKQAGHDGLKTPTEKIEKVAMMKKQAELQRVEDDLFIIDASIQSSEKNFVKEARNLLMPLPLAERADNYAYIAKFCKTAGMNDQHLTKLTSYVETVMKAQGLLEKNAGLKVDESLISDNLDARVINGDHALMVQVKTIVDKNERKEAYKNKRNLIKTEIDDWRGKAEGAILGQKVKEL